MLSTLSIDEEIQVEGEVLPPLSTVSSVRAGTRHRVGNPKAGHRYVLDFTGVENIL